MVLLPSDIRMRLARYKWNTSLLKRGFQKGSRKSSVFGSSLDFSDFRPYQPGDDVRQIDWNVYARTNRHYIKRFLDEQELSITVMLDCSASMHFDEAKWKKAKALCAAISYIGLANDDRITFVPVGAGNKPFRNKKGVVFSSQMMTYVDSVKGTEQEQFFSIVEHYRQPTTALTFIVSDCLENSEIVIDKLKKLQTNQQLRLVQLLSEAEMEPATVGDLKLIDVETKETVQVSLNRQVLTTYKQRLQAHCHEIEKACHERGIGYLLLSTKQSLDHVIFSEMRKNGWLS